MIQFYKTMQGRKFFEHDFPQLAKELQAIHEEFLTANELKEKEIELKEKELILKEKELELKIMGVLK